MTRSIPSSTFHSVVALLVALVFSLAARSASAQACCASAGLVAPTRLRSYEALAVGLQGRGRSVFGSFGADGNYTGNAAGDSESDLEQDLFAVARVSARGQVSLLIPFQENRRTIMGIADTGTGIGDIAINARYDFLVAGERRIVPGLALLVGLVLPTGTAPQGANVATGQGSTEGNVGVGIEQAYEPFFVTMTASVGLRTSRSVPGGHESFSPRLTGVIAGGRSLPHGVSLGVYLSAMRQGTNSDDNGRIPGSDVSLLTAGLAGSFSLADYWRLQGTAFGDLPIGLLGRNGTAGVGASLSIMRLWL